jgi:hypothetical protein
MRHWITSFQLVADGGKVGILRAGRKREFRNGATGRTFGQATEGEGPRMQHAGSDRSGSRRAVVAATFGNVLEWYDFSVYAFFATTLGHLFFPSDDPTASLLATFAVFGVGFVVRPLGGIVIGWMGDRYGRRPALVLTIMLMAGGTVMIGLLPTLCRHRRGGAAAAGGGAPAAGLLRGRGMGRLHRLHGGMGTGRAPRLVRQLPADVGGGRGCCSAPAWARWSRHC